MFGSKSKAFFLSLTGVGIVAPIVMMFWYPELGALLFLLGLVIAARCIALIRSMRITDTLQDTAARRMPWRSKRPQFLLS